MLVVNFGLPDKFHLYKQSPQLVPHILTQPGNGRPCSELLMLLFPVPVSNLHLASVCVGRCMCVSRDRMRSASFRSAGVSFLPCFSSQRKRAVWNRVASTPCVGLVASVLFLGLHMLQNSQKLPPFNAFPFFLPKPHFSYADAR